MQIISFLLCVALILAASESALASCRGLHIKPCKAKPICEWQNRYGVDGFCRIKPELKVPGCNKLRKQVCQNTLGCKWKLAVKVGKKPHCKQDPLALLSTQKFKVSGIASSSKEVHTRNALISLSLWPELESSAKGWKGKRKQSSLSCEKDDFLDASSRTWKAQEIASTSTNVLTQKLPTDNAFWREVESVAEGLKEYLSMGLEIDNPYFEVFYKEIQQRLISAKGCETESSIAADMDQKRKDMNMPIWQYREHLRAIHAARMDNEMDVPNL